MKKKTNGILVGLIVITVLFGVLAPVQALGVSFTIYGQVFDTDGTTPVDGVTITITDLETESKVNTEVTAEGGWYSMNLGNLKPDSTHNAGDTIQIHADNGAGKTNITNVSRAETSPQLVNVILEGGGEPVLTTIDVSPSTKELNVDDTQEFNATATDQDDNVMSGVVITWSSDNETVGTVDPASATTGDDGTAKTTLKALVVGTTTVTAANGSVTDTADVTVHDGVPPVLDTIEVTPSTKELNVDDTQEFTATATDKDGKNMSGVVITWSSDNVTVGTVNPASATTGDDGTAKTTLKALAVGETTVTAANGTVTDTADVTVHDGVPPVLDTIEVTPSTKVLIVNNTQEFTATATDQDGKNMSCVVITWSSDNETVGTVNPASATTGDDGTAKTTLKALAVGETTVTAANETVNDTADVVVLPPTPVPQITIANLKADPSTGVNEDNPTTVSATITSDTALKLVAFFAINNQIPQYMLYLELLSLNDGGDVYSAEWDATEFEVKNATTSSGTPVFTIKADEWDGITIPYYIVFGNITINETSGQESAIALFNDDETLFNIVDMDGNDHPVEPGTTTFTPFAANATERMYTTNISELFEHLEPLAAVTLTGTAEEQYNISLEKTQVPEGDYVVGLGAIDEAENEATNETTVSVSTEGYAVKISADTTEKTVAPNVKATYTLTVKNEGTKTDNYTLSITREDASVAELDIVNITDLKEGETKDVSLNVSDESAGTYTVNVTVKSDTEPSVTDVVSTVTTVKTGYEVSISTDDAEITVAPNVKATYTLTVKNEGTKTDNYTLSITREDASVAELDIVNITDLKEGDTKDVSLKVSDESVGTYTVNVTVKSDTEPNVTDVVSTVTTVKTGYEVSISTDDAEKKVYQNVKATYTLTVKNEGTKTDNYTLSITREDASVAELDITNITNLEAGKTQDVSLKVSDESVGTYTVNVTVKSLTETSVTDVVSTVTTVEVTPTPTPRKRGGGGGSGGVSDTDGDGYSDIEEIIVGTDPYDPCDPNPACLACIGEAIVSEVITTPKPTPYDPTKGITPATTKPVATVPPPEKEPEKPEKPPVPGFEAVFAIAGLLAVAYLVQRRKK